MQNKKPFEIMLHVGRGTSPVCILYLAKSERPGLWQKENLGRSAPTPDQRKTF